MTYLLNEQIKNGSVLRESFLTTDDNFKVICIAFLPRDMLFHATANKYLEEILPMDSKRCFTFWIRLDAKRKDFFLAHWLAYLLSYKPSLFTGLKYYWVFLHWAELHLS